MKNYIPFEKKEFRPNQEEAIRKCYDSIQSGNKYTILNAPTGLGKSLLAYVISKKIIEEGHQVYMSTATKILQSQYLNDFHDVKTIKGRINFDCVAEPLYNCANGLCQTHTKFKCDYKPKMDDIGLWNFRGNEVDEDNLTGMCPYWKQKMEGILSDITMLNYDYLMSDTRFVNHLPPRKLLIADEAHQIEQVLMRQLEVSFSPQKVYKETNISLRMEDSIQDWASSLNDVTTSYLELVKSSESELKQKRYHDSYIKFKNLVHYLETDPNNWVCIDEKNLFSFKPIIVSKYSGLIFDIADHVLLMSGTVLKQDVFARDLGIDTFEYIEVPSIMPPERRPIIKSYAGSMSSSNINATMPNMIAKIKMLASKHHDEKGIIHCYTYRIANLLSNGLKADDRFMFHTSNNKEQVFSEFKKDNTNKILVSPVAFEGVDFPGDEGRWQCICKDPFPNIGDLQIAAREMLDYEWIFRQRCLVLSQAYGRTNRGPDDFSVTYLLDSRIESLLGDSTLVTDYFLEALEGFRYADKLKIIDDTKLTKDNSRKSHQFDREVESQILNDIKAGYDSLGALRRAYKGFSSDAYKFITPAVQRLLKNGAIAYS